MYGLEKIDMVIDLVLLFVLQFTSPVLIVQWEGMIETGSKGIVMKEGVANAFQKWSQVNAIGNIVVIQSGKQKGNGMMKHLAFRMLHVKYIAPSYGLCIYHDH